jgi:hypothetical protein
MKRETRCRFANGLRHMILRRPYITGVLRSLVRPVSGIGAIETATETPIGNVSDNGKLSILSSVKLQSADIRFGGNASCTITVSYWARLSVKGGGSVTIQAGLDFSPAAGKSVGTTAYLCSGANLGTGCSGIEALATSRQYPWYRFRTELAPVVAADAALKIHTRCLVTLSPPHKPHYNPGVYSALITFQH